MPPNNSNSTSALSRQMRRLRRQVDKIDLRMLHLLQQRTKLSGQIGRMKRRHGAVIYVPERERELVVRLTRMGMVTLSAKAVAAIYREILSSSRAAQGQGPIGLLPASASLVLPASRARFGVCDQFLPRKKWAALAQGLDSGALSLALVTGNDLVEAFQTDRWRRHFFDRLTVVGELCSTSEAKVPLAKRTFIVTPLGNGAARKADRVLILIECKSTQNAIKSLLHAMPDLSIHAEPLTVACAPGRRGAVVALVPLSLARPVDGARLTSRLHRASSLAGVPVSILGIYPGTEDYGG